MNIKARGQVSVHVISGNDNDEFQKIKGSSVGPSQGAEWMGDSHYASERMVAGRTNGAFPPETIGASKQIMFQTGHIYEEPILFTHQQKLCKEKWKEALCRYSGMVMSVRDHATVNIFPTPNEEYRNTEWPDYKAHCDCFIQVVKGEIILNPNFVIGGKEKNFKIIPAAEDHWYIGDAKTCQSNFSTNWSETDEHGIAIGGMKNGIAPTQYREQGLQYLGILSPLQKFEGFMLLASKSNHLDENGHAQVFIPFDEEAQEEAFHILDTVQKRYREAKNGHVPAISDCKDVSSAISELPLQYPDVNKDKKMLELDPKKWKKPFSRIVEVDAIKTEKSSIIKPYLDEVRKKIKDETGISIGTISMPDSLSWEDENGKKIVWKSLKKERDDILMSTLEEVKDGPSCFYVDQSSGDTYVIEYGSESGGGVKWDSATKAAIMEDYPEVFEDLKHRFPDRAPKLSVNKAKAEELRKKSRKK